MEPLVSVIVPVYNVEKYLRQCLDSIVNQTYNNLEIILVDDGATDSSGGICDEYAKNDDRILVIHKENGGLSDARNAGMNIVQGEYLVFVDSDDLLPSNAIQQLIELAVSQRADIVLGANRRFIDKPEKNDCGSGQFQVMTAEEAMKDAFTNGCAAWARIYRSELHKNVLFPVGEINEDEAIVLQLLAQCEKIVKTTAVVYFYRERPESITTSDFSKKKLAWKEHCKANLAFVQKKYPQLIPYAAARYRGSLLWSLSEIALLDDISDYKLEFHEMTSELKRQRKLFWENPFNFWQDRVRFWMLTHTPYAVYRGLLRTIRRLH